MTNARREAHKGGVMERLMNSMDQCSKAPVITAYLRSAGCDVE